MIKSSLPVRPGIPAFKCLSSSVCAWPLALLLQAILATSASPNALAADKAPMIRPVTATPKPAESGKVEDSNAAGTVPKATLVKPAPAQPKSTETKPAAASSTPKPAAPAPAKPVEPKQPALTPDAATALDPAPLKVAADPKPKAPATATKPAESKTPDAPVAFTNSLGMRFVELPKHPILISIWKTRVRDYQAYAHDRGREPQTPDFPQSPNHPVVLVNWEDTAAFCAWLTKREHTSGTLPADWSYRLPTDEEWSAAVGLPPITDIASSVALPRQFPWGKDWPPPPGAGNYHASLRVDPYPFTSPVGAFKPNALGLYDLGGNTWEWCEDIYNNSPDQRVLRGGSWRMKSPNDLLAGARVGNQSSITLDTYGFRCVIQKGAAATPSSTTGVEPPAITR